MTTYLRRVATSAAVVQALTLATIATMPPIAQAGVLAQDGCGSDSCGVVPAAWDNVLACNSFADAINVTNYANVTNYVGYTNVVTAVNYTNQANAAAYRNAVGYATWAAGQ